MAFILQWSANMARDRTQCKLAEIEREHRLHKLDEERKHRTEHARKKASQEPTSNAFDAVKIVNPKHLDHMYDHVNDQS